VPEHVVDKLLHTTLEGCNRDLGRGKTRGSDRTTVAKREATRMAQRLVQNERQWNNGRGNDATIVATRYAIRVAQRQGQHEMQLHSDCG
jgi:hypothetical protein